MIRTKGEAGTGNIVEAVRHMRAIMGEIRMLRGMDTQEQIDFARDIEAPAELVIECARMGRLPVVNFSAGGVATPSDAALMMQLGADGVFVGSGIFKSSNPKIMAKAIVEAVNNFDNPEKIAQASRGLGDAMPGLDIHSLPEDQVLQYRGR
jgi:pyridoxal 5'-phosphate synthase pdxS subunit